MTATRNHGSDDKNVPAPSDTDYEEQACQEEIYLEVIEEELRMILEFEDPPPLRSKNPN